MGHRAHGCQQGAGADEYNVALQGIGVAHAHEAAPGVAAEVERQVELVARHVRQGGADHAVDRRRGQHLAVVAQRARALQLDREPAQRRGRQAHAEVVVDAGGLAPAEVAVLADQRQDRPGPAAGGDGLEVAGQRLVEVGKGAPDLIAREQGLTGARGRFDH